MPADDATNLLGVSESSSEHQLALTLGTPSCMYAKLHSTCRMENAEWRLVWTDKTCSAACLDHHELFDDDDCEVKLLLLSSLPNQAITQKNSSGWHKRGSHVIAAMLGLRLYSYLGAAASAESTVNCQQAWAGCQAIDVCPVCSHTREVILPEMPNLPVWASASGALGAWLVANWPTRTYRHMSMWSLGSNHRKHTCDMEHLSAHAT